LGSEVEIEDHVHRSRLVRVDPVSGVARDAYFASISFRIRSTYTGASHSRGPM
jgi:hypothetical protein